MGRVSAGVGEATMKVVVSKYPKELEQALNLSAQFTQGSWHRNWGLEKIPKADGELSVEFGPDPNPVTANGGYWTSVKLSKFDGKDALRIGGIWGAPAARRMSYCISVSYPVVRDMLRDRGWTFYQGDSIQREESLGLGERLMVPPGMVPVLHWDAHWRYRRQQELERMNLDQLDLVARMIAEERLTRSLASL